MNEVGAWLGDALVAARLVRHRPGLWAAGALGALGYLAWIPLVVTVAPALRASDLAFFGAGLFSSSAFPWNVLALAALAAIVALLGCLVAALAAAALHREENDARSGWLGRDTEAAFGVLLLAALPAAAAAAALVSGIAAVAPGEYGAPDIGVPLTLRIALRLAPLVIALLVVSLLGQAFGASAIRRAVGPGAASLGVALRDGFRDLIAHPLRRVATAAVCLLADLLALAGSIALLHLGWASVEPALAGGRLISPGALLLLLGFVAIGLVLIGAFGVLNAWESRWWSTELARAGEGTPTLAREANP